MSHVVEVSGLSVGSRLMSLAAGDIPATAHGPLRGGVAEGHEATATGIDERLDRLLDVRCRPIECAMVADVGVNLVGAPPSPLVLAPPGELPLTVDPSVRPSASPTWAQPRGRDNHGRRQLAAAAAAHPGQHIDFRW